MSFGGRPHCLQIYQRYFRIKGNEVRDIVCTRHQPRHISLKRKTNRDSTFIFHRVLNSYFSASSFLYPPRTWQRWKRSFNYKPAELNLEKKKHTRIFRIITSTRCRLFVIHHSSTFLRPTYTRLAMSRAQQNREIIFSWDIWRLMNHRSFPSYRCFAREKKKEKK